MPEGTKNLITFLQWNCDGLATKANELEKLVQRKSVDIVLLQETKLGRDDVTPRLKGFDCLRRDRPGSGAPLRRGGGLAIYIGPGDSTWQGGARLVRRVTHGTPEQR